MPSYYNHEAHIKWFEDTVCSKCQHFCIPDNRARAAVLSGPRGDCTDFILVSALHEIVYRKTL